MIVLCLVVKFLCCECVCAQIVDSHGGLSGGWGSWDKKCLLFFSLLGWDCFYIRFLFGLLFCFGDMSVVGALRLE